MTGSSPRRSYEPVRALQRGLLVMQAISHSKEATAAQLSRQLGIPRPTVIRIMETLEDMGFIERSASTGSWRLTHRCRTLSDGYNDEAWVRECAIPEIERLGREILWPVDLMAFQNYRMIVRESTHRFSPFSIIGGIVGTTLSMLETSSGRAWLAFCSPTEREEILAHLTATEKSGFDETTVNRMIAQTVKQGYGLRCSEIYKETSSLSVPIFARDRLQVVLTVVWFSSALSVEEAVRRFLSPARESAAAIGRKCDAHPDLQQE